MNQFGFLWIVKLFRAYIYKIKSILRYNTGSVHNSNDRIRKIIKKIVDFFSPSPLEDHYLYHENMRVRKNLSTET